MLKRFCGLRGWREPKYFTDPSIERKVQKAVSGLDKTLVISMRDIEQADFIIAVGADPVNEAPMLTLAMRQAYRQGATIVVIDPRPIFLPFEFHHFPVTPEEIDPCLSGLTKQAVDRSVAEILGEAAVNFYDHGVRRNSLSMDGSKTGLQCWGRSFVKARTLSSSAAQRLFPRPHPVLPPTTPYCSAQRKIERVFSI